MMILSSHLRSTCIQIALVALFLLPSCKQDKPTDETSAPTQSAALAGDINELGGTILKIRVLPAQDNTGRAVPVTTDILAASVGTIEKRLYAIGIENSRVTSKGNDQILIELVNISDTELDHVRSTLQIFAKLELKTVHPESRMLADRVAADPDNEIVPGYELKVLHNTDDEGKITTENILISRRAALNGAYIIHAQELYGPYEGQLSVELNANGADLMFTLTSKMKHGRDRLAIVLDGKALIAPVVQAALSKKFQISGMNDAAEAKALASALLAPLVNPLKIEEERTVPPSQKK